MFKDAGSGAGGGAAGKKPFEGQLPNGGAPLPSQKAATFVNMDQDTFCEFCHAKYKVVKRNYAGC